ncbi:hypothetical protein [Coleofasciculus sp.]|uniref:hypothetical protein n=1 Tax=Coleofasciculus sp. TaxID=3100458 RepID=UPI0039FA033F
MSSYPLVLIPKVLADFRQSPVVASPPKPVTLVTPQHGSRYNGTAVATTGGTPATRCLGNPRNALPPQLVVRKPPKWMRWVGSFLVVLGLIKATTVLGGVFFAAGAALIVASWLCKKKAFIRVRRLAPTPLHSQPDAPTSLPLTLSPVEQRKAHLRELASLMEGRVLLPTGTSDAPVGASEKRFGEVLNRYFSGRVFPQMEVPIPNYQHNYSTDFCLSIPEVNLWIDIEIDEPYDYKSGKPTHCCDDGRDANRNTFFLNNGWVVIRFSEQQVVDYPESCCKEIASVIKKLTGIEVFYKRLENVPQLTSSPLWTKRQAKEMAKAKVRGKYLQSKL